ncbi:MAG: DUF3368 domain-containing protein [Deltaproteobacteria bacterium]|nr:DUF3368 domain-containing protein [Deltaproteobacteria bacterium]
MAEVPVVNASPIIYLARAEELALLQVLGPEAVVPEPVVRELLRRGPADPAAKALAELDWLRALGEGEVPASLLAWDLGPGETAVLAWAVGHPSCLAVIDDRAARRCADVLGVPCIGTLGIVLRAKRLGRIPAARPVVERLRGAGMYLSDRVLGPALALVGE